MNDTRSIILAWIEQHCLAGRTTGHLGPDTPLLDDGVLDSLQIIQLVKHIESRFGVEVALEELVPENFVDANAVTSMVERLRAPS